MADDQDSKGGAPSTDDLLNALSSQMSGKKEDSSKEAEAADDAPAADDAETSDAETSDAETSEGADDAAEADADAGGGSDSAGDDAEAAPAKADPSSKQKAAGRTATGEIADAAAIFGIGGDDDDDDDDDDDLLPDDSSDLDDGDFGMQGSSKGKMIGVSVVVVILVLVGGFLAYLGEKRMAELDDANVLVDSPLEIITLYDVHQEDIKQFKIKQHHKAERAKVPIYGNLRIESEPEFADVYVECLPTDGRCNNVGVKGAPRWDSHWVRDEETKEKKCVRDEDCRVCRDATPEEVKEEGFDPRALCSIYDAKCQAGECFLPIRTATTMQSLYIGTLGGLDADRRYNISIKLAGWLEERYEVGSKDWGQQAIPGRDDSDRIFVKRFELKPDPMAPPHIKEKVDAYLKEKEEAAAAMMKEMEAWNSQGN